jgi:hypothetical protein
MSILKTLFGLRGAEPADAPQLPAGSQAALRTALAGVRPGERAWVALPDAAKLFSHHHDQYAFGDMDEAGREALAQFAAQAGVAADFEPAQGRLYFARR